MPPQAPLARAGKDVPRGLEGRCNLCQKRLKPDGFASILGVYKGNAGKQLKIIGRGMTAIPLEDAVSESPRFHPHRRLRMAEHPAPHGKRYQARRFPNAEQTTTVGPMLHIAVLEDDPDQSDLLCFWLQEAGYQCRGFNTAAAFQRSFKSLSNAQTFS